MPYKPTGRPPGRPPHPEPLTPAEQRVLRHVREGLPNSEIATRLGVSPDAVKYHVSNMLGKLQLENREELAAWREPSLPRRAWAGLTGLGWKLAVGGGVAAAAVVVAVVAVALLRGGDDEPAVFGPEDLRTGVLSAGHDGTPANGPSSNPSISADGRYVAFESEASNLIRDDNNGVSDIFVTDRLTGRTWRVSNGMNGQEANGPSYRPSISGNGEWVAFDSEASNLVRDDVNGELDRALKLLSEQSRAQLDPPTSDGAKNINARVASWGGSDVFVVERESGKIELVSVTSSGERANLQSRDASISHDGRFIAFQSAAPNLAGRSQAFSGAESPTFGDTFGKDVYLRDRESRVTQRLSVASARDVDEVRSGSGFPQITADGKHVGFVSRDGRLAAGGANSAEHGATVYVWSADQSSLRRVPPPETPPGADGPLLSVHEMPPAVSPNGQLVAFGFSGSAPVRPLQEGIPVNAIYYHIVGEVSPVPIPGTEGLGTAGSAGLAIHPVKGTIVFMARESGRTVLASYDPGAARFDVAQTATAELSFVQPTFSSDGTSLVVGKFGPPSSPAALFSSDIVVFPAP